LRDRPRRYLLVSVGTIFRTDTNSVLEVEEKLVEDEPAIKDNMERGENGMRNNWDQGSWQKANIEG
jgi:hypothetical protein